MSAPDKTEKVCPVVAKKRLNRCCPTRLSIFPLAVHVGGLASASFIFVLIMPINSRLKLRLHVRCVTAENAGGRIQMPVCRAPRHTA